MSERIETQCSEYIKFHFLWFSQATLFMDTAFNFLCSEMPPKQSEPFLLIPSETLLLGHCCQPQIKLRFVHKNPSHAFDKPCLRLTEPVWRWPKPQLPWDDPSAPSLTPPRQSSSISHPHWSAGEAVHFLSLFAATEKSHKALAAWFLTTSSSQTPQNWDSALLQLHCNTAILLSRASVYTPRLVIHIFWGLGRGNTWDEAQLFHNFCPPFFQQVNKSKDLIIFTPLFPESIKTPKNYLGNSNAHQYWNKQGYFLCCDG